MDCGDRFYIHCFYLYTLWKYYTCYCVQQEEHFIYEISEFVEHHAEFWNRKTWISILALPFTSYEALDKLIPSSRKH